LPGKRKRAFAALRSRRSELFKEEKMKNIHKTMKKAGVWIDHKEAIIVFPEGDQTRLDSVESNAESHFHPSGGWKASGSSVAQAVSNEHKAEERRKHQLHKFYQAVIQKLSDVESIYILGSGGAKHELAEEFRKAKASHGRIAAIEGSDKLTRNQIVAKVKAFWGIQEGRHLP
jgi:hypothetical protein